MAIYDLSKEIDKSKFKKRANELFEKNEIVELKAKKKRTLNQNRYLHLILGWFASEYGVSLGHAKLNYFKKQVNSEIFKIEKYNKFGKLEIEYRSSADLDTVEKTKAIDRFREWSNIEAEIYLPAPNEDQFLREIELEISRNKYI
jgi:hypothetical protein